MGRPPNVFISGTPCLRCNAPIEKPEDRYKGKGRLCRFCGNATRNMQREADRALFPMPCRVCAKPMIDGREKRFGRCTACRLANAGNCACGAVVHKAKRCLSCYRIEQARRQAVRRGRVPRQCACGAVISTGAMKCRNCNMAELGSATAQRRANAPEPVARPVRNAGAAYKGLRGGPDCEWATLEDVGAPVPRWATLDGGRV